MSKQRSPGLFDPLPAPPPTEHSEPAYFVPPDPELGEVLDLTPDFHVPQLGEEVEGIGVFVGTLTDDDGAVWWCFIEGCWRSLYDRPDAQWKRYRWADLALLERHRIEWRKYADLHTG